MRGALLAGLLAWAAVAQGQHYQYRVLIGDRDAERGVLYYDYPSGNFGALGICDPSPNANDFYYGIAIHHERGEIWVCNVLRNRIDIWTSTGTAAHDVVGLPRSSWDSHTPQRRQGGLLAQHLRDGGIHDFHRAVASDTVLL